MASCATTASPPCWLSTEAIRSLVSMAPARPTWNVKAPSAGWPSCEMTRQATTYAPSGISGTGVTTTVGSAPCSLAPSVTSWPEESISRTLPGPAVTGSSKSSVMSVGAVSRTDAPAGTDDSRAACAWAGPAGPNASAVPAAIGQQHQAHTSHRTILAAGTAKRAAGPERVDRRSVKIG